MTELSDVHETETAQPSPEWPDTAGFPISDPSVPAILAMLEGVPGAPVSEHETVYGELHDALLHALNEDAPDGERGA